MSKSVSCIFSFRWNSRNVRVTLLKVSLVNIQHIHNVVQASPVSISKQKTLMILATIYKMVLQIE